MSSEFGALGFGFGNLRSGFVGGGGGGWRVGILAFWICNGGLGRGAL